MSRNFAVETIPGVGKSRAEKYHKLGIYNANDLLNYYPVKYIDYTNPIKLEDAVLGEHNIIEGEIIQKMPPARIRQGLTLYKAVANDGVENFIVSFYNVSFKYDKLCVGEKYVFEGRINGNFLKKEMNNPNFMKASEAVIKPVYHLTEGITSEQISKNVEYVLDKLSCDMVDYLPDDIRLEYKLPVLSYALNNIHFPENENGLEISRKRLAFDELLILQLGMYMLKIRNKKEKGYKMEDTDISEFLNNMPFSLTSAQLRCIDDIKGDMSKGVPMNRLLQGDVGSGKTAVAAAALYIAAKNHRQGALMAPTEILASQHYETLEKFLSPLGIKVELLTGSMSVKQKNDIRNRLKSGEIDVITGTHALISKSTEFSSLSLVITDEQHRFGVNQRKAFAGKGEGVHKLVMSATPIPRTLSLIIYGDLDISVLNELPKGRKPVETFAVTGKLRERALGFVKEKLDKGEQGYIVCPMIEDSNVMEAKAAASYEKSLSEGFFKGYNLGLLHGQMDDEQKDEEMRKFKNGETSLLVCTTVVEVGVDVPNASVIVIENSDRFGLSQLHQLRGRVGRGNTGGTCILITDNPTEETRERLKILSSTNDGFKISEEDLKLRGAGDFFGERQHGLPSLKIADMASDREILMGAKNAAEKIISDSPDCSKYPALNAKIEEMFSDNAEDTLN